MKTELATTKPLTHLETVNESYFRHMFLAMGFAFSMLWGAIACFIHAIFPNTFQKTGSDIIRKLHDRMVENRHNLTQ